MSTTLYPGIAFSPQTTLADNIGAADTIIPVADVSCFPDGPNLATIGTDETGETVFYAAKTADALSGCQRGVEGEARTWMAGEPVGRNFTAKDHNDLIDLLSQKQDKFEGKSGQVVGFNAEGKAVPQEPPVPPDAVTVAGGGEIEMPEGLGEGPHTFEFTPEDGKEVQASQVGYDSTESGLEAETVQGALDRLSAVKVDVGRVSNPTLLNNGDFRKPINQRGQTEYSGEQYAIDRWRSSVNTTISLQKQYLHFSSTNDTNTSFYTLIEMSRLSQATEVTFSCLIRGTGQVHIGQWGFGGFHTLTENWMLHSISIQRANFIENPTGLYCFCITGVNGAVEADIIAVKLELGPVQTLAHKEGDTWVLNDPPPDPTLELAKCQSYQEKVTSIRTGNLTLGGYVAVGGEYNRLLFAEPIPFKIRKRVMPIIKDVILVPILDDGTAATEMRPTIDWSYCTEDALFQCAVSSQYAIEPGRKYYISFLADANL